MYSVEKLESVTSWDVLYENWADAVTTLQAAQDNLDAYARRHLMGYGLSPTRVLQEIVLILREQEWSRRTLLNDFIRQYQDKGDHAERQPAAIKLNIVC